MADQAQIAKLQTITKNIEGTWTALRRAAGNIAGLLQAGRATCEEVRAYNLWAVATYNTQRGMLATLRANGEKGVPELPPAPTLFTWKGVKGAQAWQIDCAKQGTSLSDAMTLALRGPTADTQYLSTHEVEIVTQDQFLTQPDQAPSFATLAAQAQGGQAGLGIAWTVVIIIAAVTIGVTVSVVAILDYLKSSSIQEANTKQTQLQADAFATYTAARLACFASCTREGKSAADCTPICAKLVDKPVFQMPGKGGGGKWGTLQWIGFTVVAGAGTLAAFKIWERRRAGRPLIELPTLDGALQGRTPTLKGADGPKTLADYRKLVRDAAYWERTGTVPARLRPFMPEGAEDPEADRAAWLGEVWDALRRDAEAQWGQTGKKIGPFVDLLDEAQAQYDRTRRWAR